MSQSESQKYYICSQSQYFDRFQVRFHRPCSMTSHLQIAAMQCPDGLILKMKKSNFYVGERLRYFDCCFVSSFSDEMEKLFIGGAQSMKLCSIRSMPMNERYDDSFISPFVHFQQIMSGVDILQILWDSHYQVVSNLINSKLVGQQSSISEYVVESFNSWCNKQREIVLNLKWLYNFTHNFVHLKVPNLLLFDNLSILFVHCQVIQCHSTGLINALYLGNLIRILEHINANNEDMERNKLQRIVLCGVTFIKLTDDEFSKYERLMRDKVKWRMEQSTNSVLTVSRMCESADPFC